MAFQNSALPGAGGGGGCEGLLNTAEKFANNAATLGLAKQKMQAYINQQCPEDERAIAIYESVMENYDAMMAAQQQQMQQRRMRQPANYNPYMQQRGHGVGGPGAYRAIGGARNFGGGINSARGGMR